MQPEDAFGENGSEIGVFNSNYLMEHYGLEEADLAEVADEFVKANAGLVNPTIIKKYVDNSGAMMDHLFIDNMFADWEAAAKTSGEHEVQCCSTGFAGKSTIFSANPLEELAGYLGYGGAAAETFIASVERYNELCRKGHDDDFFKDANHLIAIDQPPPSSVGPDTTWVPPIWASLPYRAW